MLSSHNNNPWLSSKHRSPEAYRYAGLPGRDCVREVHRGQRYEHDGYARNPMGWDRILTACLKEYVMLCYVN